MPIETIIIRLAIAAGLGMLLGLEGEHHGRSAGLKPQVIHTRRGLEKPDRLKVDRRVCALMGAGDTF